MSIKTELLSVLIKNDENFISGEKLSKELFCSRNAIWKAVKSLKADGYEIEAVTNKGYRLKNSSSLLTKESVGNYLGSLKDKLHIIVLDEVTSTNDYLKELAAKGAADGTVAIAVHQTKGKGRLGRSFYSPENTGVYLSILLRPKFSLSECLLLTTSAAVAVADAVESITGKTVSIKWVNDVFLNGKKICGILTEASTDIESGGLSYAVVGIGLNICEPTGGFPSEIKDVAGAIFESGKDVPRAKLSAEVIKRFYGFYEEIPKRTFLDGYIKRSNLIGKEVRVINGETVLPATAVKIDNDCRLLVRFDNGEEKWLSSGEVSVKLKN